MNPTLTNQLFTEFPELFKLSSDKDTNVKRYGIQCGDGWYNLIHGLLLSLQGIYQSSSDEEKAEFQVLQIKEKFGGLRCYGDFPDSQYAAIDIAVNAAEILSFITCEKCGDLVKPSKEDPAEFTIQKLYRRTLCLNCGNER